MSDWHECPNAQECTEGNRFGKGCVVDPAQSAMGGKPWHECHCGVDSDGNPPNLRQADEIARLRAENERLKRSRDRYRVAWEEEKRRFTAARAALEGL